MKRSCVTVVWAFWATALMGCGSGGGGDEDTSTDAATEDVLEDTTAPDTSPDTSPDTTEEPDVVEEILCVVDADCDDSDPCTLDLCDQDTYRCTSGDLDADGDGYDAHVGTDGVTDCGGNDCDDDDDLVYPGSSERRCGQDADCNGELDVDNDDDDYDSIACSGGDCDDEDPDINPGAAVECTADDVDCNGHEDADNDDDGHDRTECSGDDCDDDDPFTYPDAGEICLDGWDQDCDTIVDGPTTILPDVHVGSADTDETAIAWSGSEFAVVWVTGTSSRDVHFARIDAMGSVVGTALPLGHTAAMEYQPDVVWAGSRWGTVWKEDDGALDHKIYFGHVSADGTLLGTELASMAPEDSLAHDPAIAWSGSEFAVAWCDRRDGDSDLYLARMDPSGSKVGSDFAVAASDTDTYQPTLAWTGLYWAVCWQDLSTLQCGRVAGDGALVGSPVVLTTGGSSEPALTWTGSRLGLAFQDTRDTSEGDVWFIRMDDALAQVGSDLRINADAVGLHPDVAWTGSEYAFVWHSQGLDVIFARYSTVTSLLSSSVQLTSGASRSHTAPSIAWTGSLYGLVWHRSYSSDDDIYFNLVGYCE